jgi:two-component system, cell cycle response regulator
MTAIDGFRDQRPSVRPIARRQPVRSGVPRPVTSTTVRMEVHVAVGLAIAGAVLAAVSFALGGLALMAVAVLVTGVASMWSYRMFDDALTRHKRIEANRADDYVRHRIEEARWFRQLARRGTVPSSPGEDERAALGQALVVREGLFRVLRLIERSLGAQGVAVYRLGHNDTLSLWEQRLAHDGVEFVSTVSLLGRSVAGGAIGLAAKKQSPVRLQDDQGGGHRRGPSPSSVMAVPLRERNILRGVLVIDRYASFDDQDEALMLAFGEDVQAVWQTELLLDDVARDRGRLLQVAKASKALAGVVEETAAAQAALQSVLSLAHDAQVALLMMDDRGVRRLASHGVDVADLDRVVPGTMLARAIQTKACWPIAPTPPTDVLTIGDAWDCTDVRCFPVCGRDGVVAMMVVGVHHTMNLSQQEALSALADVLALTLQAVDAHERLARQATTDGLTGLCNRGTMDTKLHEAHQRASRSHGALSVILADIDHFKSVNDTYGHAAGDDVLRAVAKAMQGCARTIDIVARYGGEELCVICEGTDLAGTQVLAERMRQAIKGLAFATPKGPLHITSSFGVAQLGTTDADGPAVVQRADAALYLAKKGGRDRVIASAPTI